MKKINILNFPISFPTYMETKKVMYSRNKGYFIFANSNTLILAINNISLKKSLENAEVILPDGFPLVITARIKGIKDSRRITGPDFTINYIKYLEKENKFCCFYGGNIEQANRREEIISKLFPKLRFISFPEEYEKDMFKKLEKTKIEALFLSLGSPKQEIWAYKNKDRINAKIFCIGIALAYITGDKKRAPKLIQYFYLEWLYRLIIEPKKSWKRYLINGPKFLALSLNEILFK